MVQTLIHGFFTGIGFFCSAIIASIGYAAEFILAVAEAL